MEDNNSEENDKREEHILMLKEIKYLQNLQADFGK